ncbi:MAG: chorismate-binding protein [Betaproteobacteria bacterium]|nr:chorismate-binding protein [Betaproteobacteria bacterium]
MLADVPAFPAEGKDPRSRLRLRFRDPVCWLVAREPADVAPVIDSAHREALAGRWCVGWMTYEAAAGLNPVFRVGEHLHPPVPGSPLAAFAVFDRAHEWLDDGTQAAAAPWKTSEWTDSLSLEAAAEGGMGTPFAASVQEIRARIRDGDVYQVNLTTPLASRLENDADAYFHALRSSQPDGYVFHIPHRLGLVPQRILSVSPELFFHWHDGIVTARPMKGTAPRGATAPRDAQAAQSLRADEKERAENLMIVDLTRNDLSRIAVLGSVRVPTLFEVQALPTVWQMTSTVTAQTVPGLALSALFAALFPCGSVTGAPKRSAMGIIHRLEPQPRGVYCGAIGLLRPGGSAVFNVPIRTVVLDEADDTPASARPSWRAVCGVGSGITHDSTAPAEAREWLHKKAFLVRAASAFDLLETLRLEEGVYWLLDGHLRRLADSARHFGRPCEMSAVTRCIEEVATTHPTGLYRVRLRVDASGRPAAQATPLPATAGPVRLAWAREPMPRADEFIRHKTTRRDAYAPHAPQAGGDWFDTVLRNRDGALTETTFGNVALRIEGRWLTPSADAGLLPGVYRAHLLAEGRIEEARLTVEDPRRADALAFLNSVRGWLEADWPDFLSRWTRWRSDTGAG